LWDEALLEGRGVDVDEVGAKGKRKRGTMAML
jgi:hypothetical protein